MAELSQFRDQAFRLLTKGEAAVVKGALVGFVKNPDVPRLVAALTMIFTTPEKEAIFATIGQFMPKQYRDWYTAECPTGGDSDEDKEDYENSEPIVSPGMRSSLRVDDAAAPRGQGQGRASSPADARRTSPSSVSLGNEVVPMSEFILGPMSRQESEDILGQNGLRAGSFLVRKKDVQSQGSFKLKPGQTAPGGSWALSYVRRGGTISHQLLTQQRPGEVITIGTQQLGRCTTLPQLVEFLKTDPDYMLTTAPLHAQLWYHGEVSREAAEKSLLKLPVPGRYLVRKSTREPKTFVVSYIDANSVPTHKKALQRGSGWVLAHDLSRGFDSIADCMRALPLAQPCPISRLGGRGRGGR